MMIRKRVMMAITLCLILISARAQDQVIDEVVATVGSHMILLSDLEQQYMQMRTLEGFKTGAVEARCQILESMLFQKLMLNQAEFDSLKVSDEEVDGSIDSKLRYYVQQFGSRDKLEAFYKKSIDEIKAEFREPIREQLLEEQVQQKITQDIKVTPSEVKRYFNAISADSIPLIATEYEIGELVKDPPLSPEELAAAKEKITALRARIVKGEKFATLAILYSEDPGSAPKGGELGLFGRGDMYPEFEAAAFSLKKGDVSDVIKTKAGYHILQLIERRGEYVNVRHILIIPKVSPMDIAKAKTKLDSIADLIRKDSLTFEKAALKYSDDPNRINGGLLINPASGNSRFEASQIDREVFFVVDKMKVGDISKPVPMTNEEGKEAYRLLYLKVRTQPHRASLREDYSQVQEWALGDKRTKAISEWIAKKISTSYVNVTDTYKSCKFLHKWF
jgi:peptidyl-prolyl cis-trans isomerase SurA